MVPANRDIARQLAHLLLNEVYGWGGDRVQFLMFDPKKQQKVMVVVTITEKGTENLLEYLDQEIDAGLVNSRELLGDRLESSDIPPGDGSPT